MEAERQAENEQRRWRGKRTMELERKEESASGATRTTKEDEHEIQDEHIHAKVDVFTHVVPMHMYTWQCSFSFIFSVELSKSLARNLCTKNCLCKKTLGSKPMYFPSNSLLNASRRRISVLLHGCRCRKSESTPCVLLDTCTRLCVLCATSTT